MSGLIGTGDRRHSTDGRAACVERTQPAPCVVPQWTQKRLESTFKLVLSIHLGRQSISFFFDPQHGPNTNVVRRARDAHKLAQAKRASRRCWNECRGHNQAKLRPFTAKTGVRVP